jgi:xanthine dehydrogenase YagT iron-sulfur-binding subunit
LDAGATRALLHASGKKRREQPARHGVCQGGDYRLAEDASMPRSGFNRREFLQTTALSTGGVMAAKLGLTEAVAASAANPPPRPLPPDALNLTLEVNGRSHAVAVDPRTSLLDALRERLGMMGTKKGCDMGACGACTVHVDGRRVVSCLTLAASVEGKRITTIEGLAQGEQLHPVQAAFVEHDGFQCGYCTPGQIMSAVALIDEGRATSDAAIREFMSGNICRCGAYPNIVAAIKTVASGRRV